MAYSEDELYDQESISDEFSDFEKYCRRKLTGTEKIRRPTHDEISDHANYATLEVLAMYDHIKIIMTIITNKKCCPLHPTFTI